MPSSAWTYMGVLDDAAVDHPWNFKLTDAELTHLLVVELLQGKPVLLNDGYLVNHPFARNAIVQRHGLLWELIQQGYVGVMARGGSRYSLDQMPVEMARSVDSFRDLVAGRRADADWPILQRRLSTLDNFLRQTQQIVDWPRYHAGSGFLALSRRLLERNATPHSLGVARHVSKSALRDFLTELTDNLSMNRDAPRSKWTSLARKYAANSDYTNEPGRFVRALMNLANELYHYNMGLMLAADNRAAISVQTQTSPAFDDLLFPPALKFLVRDLSNAPRLHVPRRISSVDPHVLAQVLDPDSRVFASRRGWLQLRDLWEVTSPERRPVVERELSAAGKEYSARLTEHVGLHVRYNEPEKFIDYVIGFGPALVGGAIGGIPGGLLGFGIGYGISRAKDRVVGSVVRKFRIEALKGELRIPQRMAEQSERAIATIKRRGAPSTIELPSEIAASFATKLEVFADPS
jgi:hypothetical protein